MTRGGWAILPTDRVGRATAKFARRGLKAIVLDEDPRASKEVVLATLFTEIRRAWEREVLPQITANTDTATAELRRA